MEYERDIQMEVVGNAILKSIKMVYDVCFYLLSACMFAFLVPKFPYQATSSHRWFSQVRGRAQTLQETFSLRRLHGTKQVKNRWVFTRFHRKR